jgi:hypothetical protein
LPVFGHILAFYRQFSQNNDVDSTEPPELVRHVSLSSGLSMDDSARLVADVVNYFGETVDQFVRRRHRQLHDRSVRNADIWTAVTAELAQRRFTAPPLSERQLRRMVYG